MSEKDQTDRGSSAGDAKILLEFIRESAETIALPKGSTLFQEGEPCRGAYYVVEGELELTLTSGEKRLRVQVVRPGHLLAIASVISNSDHQCSAYAVQDSKLAFIAAEQMMNFLRQPEPCLVAIENLGADLLDLSEKAIRPLRLQPRYSKPH